MKANESSLDRVIRAVVGIVLLALALTNVVTGTLGILLIVIGALLVLTAAVSWCPLYALLKFSTKKS